jgi:putative oxygen-independent coproporphyrinogen III oxidase
MASSSLVQDIDRDRRSPQIINRIINTDAGGDSEPVEAIYIHIPFCRRKCFYCDFAIATIDKQDVKQHYVETVCQEIALTASNAANVASLKTVFFGGGTPSLLSPLQLGAIIDAVSSHFGINKHVEISLEANPGTVTLESLKGYQSIGVNRVSLGAQAFQVELLDQCGRGHDVDQIFEAVAAIKAAGIENFGLDLISGLPDQTLDQWQHSLEQAIALQPQHMSVYDLTIESGTAFGKRYQPGDLPLPSEADTVQMYLIARSKLQTAGYEHYEISNYARPGYQCQHNRTYWLNQPFYGVGMGATSYYNHQRIDRPRKLSDYWQMIDNWINCGIAPTAPVVSPSEELMDALMQGLRLAEGLNLDTLEQKYGKVLCDRVLDCLTPYFKNGWAIISHGQLMLIPPDGWLFSNEIISALFAVLDGL